MLTYFLTESASQIAQKINRALKDELNKLLPKTVEPIEDKIKELTYQVLKQTEEYNALVNGELLGEFGFYRGSQQHKVESVIDEAIQQIHVEFIPISNITGSVYNGGLQISILEGDFAKIVEYNHAHIITEKGYDLPWLKWLLIEGDKIIVQDYSFAPGKAGRSGRGIMRKGANRYWRVPPEYKGIVSNNWFTRALYGSIESFKIIVGNIIQEEIERRI